MQIAHFNALSRNTLQTKNAATIITNYRILEMGAEILASLKSVALKLLDFQQFSSQSAVPYYNNLTCH